MDIANVMGAVWGCLLPFHPALAQRVKRARQGSLNEARSILTIVEREPGLEASPVRIVAMAKQVLAGKDDEGFWMAVLKAQGLI